MSQTKLTLRPPPNIDFVQGYPGIPPGAPDRPQAAVKGAIEVRVGPQGVRAKWVRIELRKVETLPGGGLTNTFFDFVGQSPIHVWQSDEEYSVLNSRDFPFYIRIPESIPPSIALEKGAGVKYELIATICVKGKKGFLRRDKPNHITTSCSIIIDKHELHSTWPVYQQPEGRKLSQDGITLIVERTRTCYGPGDRISIMTAVKSDTLHTVILRGFEFYLKETVVFRAGPNSTGKKAAPQAKSTNVSEQKVPVNATLYGGTQHKAELAVTVPPHHTNTTLNAARHIDINYSLVVSALMATGKPLVMELPVIISNWPRSVSIEAVKKIGLAPNVSAPSQATGPQDASARVVQQPPAPISPPVTSQQQAILGRTSFQQTHPHSTGTSSSRPGTSGTVNESSVTNGPSSFGSPPANANVNLNKFQTSPGANGYGYGGGVRVNEWGVAGETANAANTVQTIGSTPVGSSSAGGGGGGSGRPAGSSADPSETSSSAAGGATPRPRQSRQATLPRPLTIANYNEDNPEEAQQAKQAAQVLANARSHARQASMGGRHPSVNATAGGSASASAGAGSGAGAGAGAGASGAGSSSSSSRGWLTAEEEKRRLYDDAVARVERVQGGVARAPSPPTRQNFTASPIQDAGPILRAGDIPQQPQAQAQAQRPGTGTSSRRWPTAEEEKTRLYNEAQAAAQRAQGMEGASGSWDVSSPTPSQSTLSSPQSSISAGAALYSQAMSSINRPVQPPSPPQPQRSPPIKSPTPQYPSAEEEKAALRRYHEAKAAVERTQGSQGYADAPPPQTAPISYDALYPPTSQTSPRTNGYGASPPPPNNELPPAFDQGGSSSSSSAQPVPSWKIEKERLRRAYEAQDAAASNVHASPALSAVGAPAYTNSPFASVPVPAHVPMHVPVSTPPPPQPPVVSAIPPMSSAAAEKERLRRMYEAQDAAVSSGGPPPTPPPRTRGTPPRPGSASGGSSSSSRPALPTPRGPPAIPNAGGSQPLSAAEEKARLKAIYEAEDQQSNSGHGVVMGGGMMGMGMAGPAPAYTPPSSPPQQQNGLYRMASITAVASPQQGSVPPPPPLAPRPPKEYIQETQEEDARIDARLRSIDQPVGSFAGSAPDATPKLGFAPDYHAMGYVNGANGNGNENGGSSSSHSDELGASVRPPIPAKSPIYID